MPLRLRQRTFLPILTAPSSYLQVSLARWSDRATLARRDVEMMMDGLEVKGHFIEGFRLKVLSRRKEDLVQLQDARREAWAQWDERLKRLGVWIGASTVLGQSSGRVLAWKDQVAWFDRAQNILARYAARLDQRAAALENQIVRLGEQTTEWCDRLILKESEASGVLRMEGIQSPEPMITSTRKRSFMEFVYAEREKEGELARHFKTIRGAANAVLDRLFRTQEWISRQTEINPAHFEIRRNQMQEFWNPLQKRFTQIREVALSQALLFEEGRTRLRAIYDMLQKARIIQDEPPSRRPLLERLFKQD